MGEDDPLGEPIRFMMVEEIVLRAACLARSVLTKLDTKSSRFPLRSGEARSSKGVTSGAGTDLPRSFSPTQPHAGQHGQISLLSHVAP
jgi:hypothetical protein